MRIPTAVVAGLTTLLAVRFFADVSLVGMNLPPGALGQATAGIAELDVVLAILLFAALVFLVGNKPPARDRRRVLAPRIVILGVLAVTMGTWLSYVSGSRASIPGSLFPPLAVVSVTLGADLSVSYAPAWTVLRRRWWGLSYVALLVVVPVAFGMRTAALLGLGTVPGPSGALQGDWSLVNLPTLLLELLAIGVWLWVVSGAMAQTLRERRRAFLPFLGVPPALGLFVAVPLAESIFSATISWGANLEVFRPVEASLGLALVAIACYGSTFLWVRRDGPRPAWRLLALGTASVVLAGFSLSIVSVAGLTFGLVVAASALSEWTRS